MLTAIASTIVGVAPASAASGFFGGEVVRAHDAEAEMLDTINRVRAQYGLSSLRNQDWGQYEDYLNCLAADNASIGGLEHYPSSCGQSIVEAEILAARYDSFNGGSTNLLVKQWNESTGHRQTMLAANADYAYVGVFCIGHTSWAVSWIGADNEQITSNTTAPQDIGAPFFTDNDYHCKDSAPEPQNGPLGAYVPGDSLDAIVNRDGFDTADADVLRLYRAFFRRDPEVGGANYWLGLTALGVSIDAISAEFALSEEFNNTYGSVNNRTYLEILYQNILGRQPDAEGFDYWLGQLNSGALDRGGVVRWISANDEFINSNLYGGK